MAKVYTGRDGRLLIDGTEQIKVSNWTLTGSLEVLETTTLGRHHNAAMRQAYRNLTAAPRCCTTKMMQVVMMQQQH
jgi:hypothetical protein